MIASLIAIPSAEAQMSARQKARYCAQLEGQLAKLQRVGTSRSSRNFEKYDAAVHKQQAQIDSALKRAKRDACVGGGGFFRRSPKPTCPALMKRIDKMKRNLTRLNRKRGKYTAPAKNTGRQKAEIVQKLARARCGEQYAGYEQVRPTTRRQGLFGALFGARPLVRERDYDNFNVPNVGTYRTVCVRQCDGYFFPISFSTTKGNFGRDQSACQASCPGTDVELFSYKNPGETSEDMVSMSGVPYRSTASAFRYQKEYVKGCSCQVPQSKLTALTSSDLPKSKKQSLLKPGKPSLPEQTGPIVPLPMSKPLAMVDPDTRETARLGQKFTPYRPPEVSSDKRMVHASDGRSIRIVGPKFFGTPE